MTQDQVLSQRQQGYRGLRFVPELERAFQQGRAQMMRERARPVAASALVLFLLYSVLDWWFFPTSLSSQTIAVRLLVICPIIVSVLVLSYRMASVIRFARYYVVSYLCGGLGLLFIIWLSRRQAIDMPYDGVLLMLMFGFFLMGLPFRSVSLTSAVIVLLYVALEVVAGLPARSLMFNCFFLITAYVIGVVGAWLQEYQLRTHFLDRTQLALSRSAAEDESARKTQVLAAAGHDLRQPLNVVNLLLENLASEPRAAARADIMAQLRRTLAHFGKLLGSLLDLSRLREGLVRPQLTSVSVPDLVDNLMESFRGVARGRGVRMEYASGGDLAVKADPLLLHRVLQNLIGNVLAHSGADTLVLETASQFDQVRIWVKDNGRGVTRENQARLFDAFFRGADRQPGQGLGLGLAIVQQLIVLMNGRCGYEPGERGSRFWVELPRARADAAPGAHLSGLPDNRAVLLIEDHRPTRVQLASLLGHWGFEVESCASAEAALDGAWLKRRLRAGQPFIVLTDLHLPGMTGFEVLDRIRERQPEAAAVVMTADSSESARYDAISRTWVLQKPLSPGRLRAALQRFRRGGAGVLID